MASIAIYLKTESGDSYLYSFPDISPESIANKIKEQMGGELGYVAEVLTSPSDNSEASIRHCKKVDDLLEKMIEEIWEEE